MSKEKVKEVPIFEAGVGAPITAENKALNKGKGVEEAIKKAETTLEQQKKEMDAKAVRDEEFRLRQIDEQKRVAEKKAGRSRAQKLREQLDELKRKMSSSEEVKERIHAMKEIAPEQVKLLKEAKEIIATLNQELGGGEKGQERWRRTPFRQEGEDAESVIAECLENPFVKEIFAQQRQEERIAAVSEMRKEANLTLHEAVEGKDGAFAIRVAYEDKYTCRDRSGWLLVTAEGDKVIVSESLVPFVKAGLKVPLDPPEFQYVRGDDIRRALQSLWKYEEKMAERQGKTKKMLSQRTTSFTKLMAGEKGVATMFHKEWKNREGVGPLSIAVEGDGEGNFTLKEFLAPRGHVNLGEFVGKKMTFEEMKKTYLGKIIEDRLKYEAKKTEENAAATEASPPVKEKDEPKVELLAPKNS